MSVEVANETEWQLDPKVFSELGLWVMHQMRVSTQSELTITFVDPEPIAELHERWMDLQGPTDVMSFPMDELRPGDERNEPEGIARRHRDLPGGGAATAQAAGHSTMEEMMLLTIHGVLHLLGYDHPHTGAGTADVRAAAPAAAHVLRIATMAQPGRRRFPPDR